MMALRVTPVAEVEGAEEEGRTTETANSLINRFQECFHPYFPISIVIPIKVRWNNKRVFVFHDNWGQGSALRSKDLQ